MTNTVRLRWSDASFTATNPSGELLRVTVKGRDRWALESLIASGSRGCTPFDTPGPRWSGYVFNLRSLGLVIETLNEGHGGPFAGTHARYVLRSTVTRSESGAVAA